MSQVIQEQFLRYDPQRHQFFLLGYPLKLSPTEEAMMAVLLQDGWCRPEELVGVYQQKPTTSGVPVHIHSINRKAEAISGRKLIRFSHDSYYITRKM